MIDRIDGELLDVLSKAMEARDVRIQPTLLECVTNTAITPRSNIEFGDDIFDDGHHVTAVYTKTK